MKTVGLVHKFHKWISIKIQPYPVHAPEAMLETLELSESVNSADLVILNILYLGL
jgi:hypothetical protein